MRETGKSGIYNATPYRAMLDVELTTERFTVHRSFYGIRGKTLVDIPIDVLHHVCLRRSIILLFFLCLEVAWTGPDGHPKTVILGTFKRQRWLKAFAERGISVLPQQPLRV